MKELLYVFLSIPSICLSQNINDGLIGYWPLDNDAVDLSINQYNGTLNSTTPVKNRFNEPGTAILFDNNSHVDFGDILDVGTNDFSICAWFKLSNTITGDQTIVAKSDYSGSNHRYGILIRQ